ncbi:LANO_0B02960g1_1 [Lachancea nothofagi CBS 11611]|uniref:LANO_0B02960g1_1 n=1 Tax=Lachancea nothofagi CBS 11611 TaxID=1266666 RepID=A0A1G4IWD5_9SACH|nr:LANO_0B02960g1_1 [Lachancea nothofagi CBS 11611]
MSSSQWNPEDILVTFQNLSGAQAQVDAQQLQDVVNRRIALGILYGTRIGAAVITIVILLMVSKNRKTPIFISNQISLLLIVIQSGVYLGYLFSPFASVSFTIASLPDTIPNSNLRLFSAANIFQVLLVAAVEASLILQVRIIFKSDTFKTVGRVLVAISTALAIATIAMFLVSAVKSITAIYSDVQAAADTIYFNIAVILQSTSINFMTLLLTVKLVLAVRSRRFLGLKQFDSFHILAIMSFQTLIFPSLLFILAYALSGNQGTSSLNSIAVLLVTLSLPLSSMWATSANNACRPSSLNTYFAPSIYDGTSTKTDDRSIFSQPARSSGYQRSYEQAYDLYPVVKADPTQHEYNYDVQGMDKANFQTLAVSINTAGNSSTSSKFNQDKQPELGHLERAIESGVYTPNTLDDEDARNFWSGTKS